MSAVQDPSEAAVDLEHQQLQQAPSLSDQSSDTGDRLPNIQNILNKLEPSSNESSSSAPSYASGSSSVVGLKSASGLLDLPSSFSQYSMLSPLYGSGNLGHIFVLPPPVSSFPAYYPTPHVSGSVAAAVPPIRGDELAAMDSRSGVAAPPVGPPKIIGENGVKSASYGHPNNRLGSIADQLYPAAPSAAAEQYRPPYGSYNHQYEHSIPGHAMYPAPAYHQHPQHHHYYPYGYLDNYYQTAHRKSVTDEITISNEELQLRKFQPYNKKRRASNDSSSNSTQQPLPSEVGDMNSANGTSVGSAGSFRPLRAKPATQCHSCNTTETPEWRRGPDGARTLCNACGLHYAKLLKKRKSALDLTSRDPSMQTNDPVRLLAIAATNSHNNIVHAYPVSSSDVSATAAASSSSSYQSHPFASAQDQQR